MKSSVSKETDLLIGLPSIIPNTDKHFFLADFDNTNIKKLMEKVGRILFDKYKFGAVYLIKSSDKNYHLVSFSKRLTLKEYLKILKEMGSDEKFIEWVKKVKYGVIRLSRRSSHFKVPVLLKALIPPYKYKEDIFYRNLYFSFLKLESKIFEVKRVLV